MFWQYPAYVVSAEIKTNKRRTRDHTLEVVGWFAGGADDVTRDIGRVGSKYNSRCQVARKHRTLPSLQDGEEHHLSTYENMINQQGQP